MKFMQRKAEENLRKELKAKQDSEDKWSTKTAKPGGVRFMLQRPCSMSHCCV